MLGILNNGKFLMKDSEFGSFRLHAFWKCHLLHIVTFRQGSRIKSHLGLF